MIRIPLEIGPGGQLVSYVRATTDAGTSLAWAKSCVYITHDAAGSSDLPGTEEYDLLARVLDTWETSVAGCSYMHFVVEEPIPSEVGFDGVNLIKYREETWCRPPEEAGGQPDCYSPRAAAITTLFFVDHPGDEDDGTILDADIEMNSVDFSMAVGCATTCRTEGDGGSIADAENTLTHEVGHLLGLDHTCWEGAAADAPLDDQGDPAPPCQPESALPEEVTEATMYNFQGPAETKKITLHADDIQAICEIYPLAEDPGDCSPVDPDAKEGCCAVAGTRRDGTGGWLAGLVMALTSTCHVVLGRRRRAVVRARQRRAG
jgi:hypothetical protein